MINFDITKEYIKEHTINSPKISIDKTYLYGRIHIKQNTND